MCHVNYTGCFESETRRGDIFGALLEIGVNPNRVYHGLRYLRVEIIHGGKMWKNLKSIFRGVEFHFLF